MKPFSKALSSRTISAYPWTVNFPRRYQHVRERSTFIPFWTSSRFWKALRLKITKPVSPKLKRMSKSFLLVKLFHVIWVQRIFYSKEKRLGSFLGMQRSFLLQSLLVSNCHQYHGIFHHWNHCRYRTHPPFIEPELFSGLEVVVAKPPYLSSQSWPNCLRFSPKVGQTA